VALHSFPERMKMPQNILFYVRESMFLQNVGLNVFIRKCNVDKYKGMGKDWGLGQSE
jgi:hypothetical protein